MPLDVLPRELSSLGKKTRRLSKWIKRMREAEMATERFSVLEAKAVIQPGNLYEALRSITYLRLGFD